MLFYEQTNFNVGIKGLNCSVVHISETKKIIRILFPNKFCLVMADVPINWNEKKILTFQGLRL